MEIATIISSLRRNRVGPFLIALQVALTLAIVCNAFAVIGEHMQHMRRPTGLDEPNTFTLTNIWAAGQHTDLKARIQDDMRALRSLPGVIDASASNSFPLRGGGMGDGIALKRGQRQPTAQSAIYMVDEHALSAWGLRLVAGRWFEQHEIGALRMGEKNSPPGVVVTRALANALFPQGDALGKGIYLTYLNPQAPTRIVGIVERAQSPWAAVSWAESFIENATFVPFQFVNNGLFYIVRTQPGQVSNIMRRAEKALYDIDISREIALLQPFTASRDRAYRFERSVSLILATVCFLLLTVSVLGIVGLTTYWVVQRRRQIGVRRALGARRLDIMRYFQVENLLITAAGVALGVVFGLAVNLWLATSLQLTRMSTEFILAGALLVLILGQLAVIWPALRAIAVPPALAARGA